MGICCAAAMLSAQHDVQAQSKLYPRLFDLQEVTLHEGVFKTAMDLNCRTLLEYDIDRLLTPYFRQAGITGWEAEHPNFLNWGSGNFRLDGHVGGHYLSALALAYAATKDGDMRARMKERMDYMVDKMAECQAVFDDNTAGLYGYIGGLPDNGVWTGIRAGNFSAYNRNRGNVPFYTMHKVYAGLRDAWVYGGNEKARVCFLKLCDWGVNLISGLTDAQVQDLLSTEHGGINEVYADAYQMTGEEKYLTAARRYSQTEMVSNMQTVNSTFLDNKHANTQVPKYIGFARVAQQDDRSDAATVAAYRNAAHNFWTEVVSHRTLALGGNSIAEHFLPASRCADYINNPDGPESCNTNNMLKLTEDLFADCQNAGYADFYEQAMTNHILSTQNPTTGGYVYFTSLRPQHYRMYSQVNQGMWCCVGTGMENHSKYGEFVYARSLEEDTLYVNLFVASELNDETFAITQETRFPYEQQAKLTVNKAGSYKLAVRHPSWCTGGYKITVNGEEQTVESVPGGYAVLSREWAANDEIVVSLPMHMELVECPNYPSYVAFRYGPVLLGAVTSTENLTGQFAGEGRMDHCPSLGAQLSLTSAPMLIGNRDDVLDSVYVDDITKLHFKIRKGLYSSERFADLVLQPFFTVHEARYMMYWNQLSADEWQKIKDQVLAEEAAAQKLSDRTLDFVATGEQQSDAGHVLLGDFEKGSYSGEFYIDALRGKWFSYELETKDCKDGVSLMCRYHSADAGRVCTIYINDEVFQTVTLSKRDVTGFYNVEYPVPSELLTDKDGNPLESITVKFEASGSTPTPGLYYLRLLKDYEPLPVYTFVSTQWISGDANRVNSVAYDADANTVTVYGKPGNNNIALQFAPYYDDNCYLTSAHRYFAVCGSSLQSGAGQSYLWWLNGANHGTQVAPAYSVAVGEDRTLFVWDVATSGLNDNLKADSVMFSTHGKAINTVFGLTSSADDGTAVISDIGFYTIEELLAVYPEMKKVTGYNIFDENATACDFDATLKKAWVKKRFKAKEWTAICTPFDIYVANSRTWFSSIKEYVGMVQSDDALTLYFADAKSIIGGKLYLVLPRADYDVLDLTSTKVTAEGGPESYEADGMTVTGTFVQMEKPDASLYTYKDGVFAFDKETDEVKGMSMYMCLSDEKVAALKSVQVSFDAMPDAIAAVRRGENASAAVYTLDGVKCSGTLEDLPHGIYIVGNRKKVK